MKSILLTLLFSFAFVSARAANNGETVALSATLAAVQRVINSRIGDGKLESIDKSREGGEETFEVDWTDKAGKEGGFKVAVDGTLLSVEVELSETPAAVQKTIKEQANGFELESLNKNVEDPGDISYDVQVAKDGKTNSFTVDGDGKLSSKEVALAETPGPVQEAIKQKAGGSQIKSIDQNFDDEVTFEVTVASGGTETSFSVSASGNILMEQVDLERVPPAVKKTMREHIGDGTILRVDKSLSEKKGGVFPYEIHGRKDGKPFDFFVGPRGRFLGMDE